MKQAMTLDAARRLALETGSELLVDGKRFNSAGTVVEGRAAKPAPPTPVEPEPAPPPPAPEPTFSREDVRQLLADQETRLRDEFFKLIQGMGKPQAQPATDDGMVPVGFLPEYDKDGAITVVKVRYERLQ